ncbi:MAG: fluoride efflux transporter CrcB [Bacteroidota bacterium]
MLQIVAVFIGGGLGSVLRFGISKFSLAYLPFKFPLATLLSNIIACLVLALVLYAGQKIQMSQTLKILIAVGFCGGLSTFSTFSAETFELIKSGLFAYAIANILISVVGCLGLFYWFYRS